MVDDTREKRKPAVVAQEEGSVCSPSTGTSKQRGNMGYLARPLNCPKTAVQIGCTVWVPKIPPHMESYLVCCLSILFGQPFWGLDQGLWG